jgi:cation transport protein ChaC
LVANTFRFKGNVANWPDNTLDSALSQPDLQSFVHPQARSMSLNTTDLNRRFTHFDGHEELWLFGYGSLIYKADFPFLECRRATLPGYVRRFWQGSHDHRGSPTNPGRVVTLIPHADSPCIGMAYRITPDVFAHLDHREKNGYLRAVSTLHFDDRSTAEALIYIADQHNAAWLGSASEEVIARQIATANGPSGPNRDYLLRLAEALRELDTVDEHVFAIEAALLALEKP